MARDELEHDRDRVAGLAAGEVDRVVPAPTGREVLVDRREQVVGQRARAARSPSRAIASAVTTPQPPAVVTTAVRGPAGSGCVANVAAASKASSIVVARVMPAWRHMPGEHALVGGERAGVARRGALAAGGRAALHEHDRLRRGRRRASARRARRPSATPSTYARLTAVASSPAYQSR